MISTIYMTCMSCKSRDWFKNISVRPNNENAASARASGSFWSIYLSITYSTWKVLGVTFCCFWSTCDFDQKAYIYLISNAHVHHNYLQKYQWDQNTCPALFKIGRMYIIIFIISAWTVKCMPLHFWVLCGICSSYRWFSLHLKSLWKLVVYLKINYIKIYVF